MNPVRLFNRYLVFLYKIYECIQNEINKYIKFEGLTG